MQNSINPFNVEEMRARLALERNFSKLKKTYSEKYPEIPDKNTSKFWNYLNLEGKALITKNPMEKARLIYVNKLIKDNTFSLLHVGFGSASLEEIYFKNKSSSDNIFWKGIDISDKSVKEAKIKFPHCKFEFCNIINIKEKNEMFDYVVSLEVLEHIKPSKIFKALSEIYRVLKAGGYFIASVPLNEGLEEMISRGENPNAHVRIYTPELIKAELEIAGFKIIKEKRLFAFHNFYLIKTFIAKYFLTKKFYPNNIIILAQKP